MDTFPILDTHRLILRKIQIEDVPALVQYANNKKISDNILNIPSPYREPDAVFRIGTVVQGFKKKTSFAFAIILKDINTFIGEISLHLDKSRQQAQLAYWIGEPFWNKGITTEAIAAVLDFGFEQLKLELIYADCYAHNVASEKVMLKNGMVKHSRNGNLLLYRLTQEEYLSQKST